MLPCHPPSTIFQPTATFKINSTTALDKRPSNQSLALKSLLAPPVKAAALGLGGVASAVMVVKGKIAPLGPRIRVSFPATTVVGVALVPMASVVPLSIIFDASIEIVRLSTVREGSVGGKLGSLGPSVAVNGDVSAGPNALMIRAPRPAASIPVCPATTVFGPSSDIRVSDRVMTEPEARVWPSMTKSEASLAV